MTTTRDAVHAAVRALLAQKGAAAGPPLDDARGLRSDLGFDSLDLAQLVAGLELSLGVDPFAEQVAVARVVTLGDLCRAYEGCPRPAGAGAAQEPA